MNRAALAALAALLMVTACTQPVDGRESVAAMLLDPASAQFHDVRLMVPRDGEPDYVCGEVRGTSALGGPGQPVHFVLFGTPDTLMLYGAYSGEGLAGPTILHAGAHAYPIEDWHKACGASVAADVRRSATW